MSLGPILPGRMPTSLLSSRLRDHLQHDTRLLAHLRDQIATGQKFFVPSEAPAAAVRSIVLQKAIERKQQMQVNVQIDRSFLTASEAALADVTETLNRAKSFALAGVGTTSTEAERQVLADQAASLVSQLLGVANTKFQGRYLFGGTYGTEAPFERVGNEAVRYNGDASQIQSYVDLGQLLVNNVDGQKAFGALSPPIGDDLDPALTAETKIADLNRGTGLELGPITVTLDDPGLPATVTQTVDLSGAETIVDVETLLENAFAASSITLDVDIDPTTNSALRLTASSGTVAVSDVDGSRVAASLGLTGTAAASVVGADLDPRLSLLTPLSALNNGNGISVTPGQGLLITHGEQTAAVDLSDPSIQTVEDVLNAIRLVDPDLDVGLDEAGNGLSISSRLSGKSLSIGENGDTTAADLGIRTFTGETLLADLNRGRGAPVEIDPGDPSYAIELKITRRDGTTTEIDVSNFKTVQDVIDAIDADAGLSASLNGVGNGITITDLTAGTGPLIVAEDEVSTALGIAGEVAGPTLTGEDVNPIEDSGAFSTLIALEHALRTGDDAELERLAGLIEAELERVNVVRGDVGNRLHALEEIEARLLDDDLLLRENLSREFDTDLTEAITQVAQKQATLEATLQVAASTLELTLFAFL